jgi:hypothetical protein
MIRLFFLLFLQIALFSTDFDSIFIGSSPFCIFEALHRARLGEKVLILEEAPSLGGAWKTIDICGVKEVDMGCHLLGKEPSLKEFLKTYAGCNMIPLDISGSEKQGHYFSQGCKELMKNLSYLIHLNGITVFINQKAKNAWIDHQLQTITLSTSDNRSYVAKHLVLTPMSSIVFDQSQSPQKFSPTKHYHLYLLIQDPTPTQFSYKSRPMHEVSRMMNLTPYTNLAGTGKQLIAIQTTREKNSDFAHVFLEELKKNNLCDASAELLLCEPYIYQTSKLNQMVIKELKAENIIQVLETGSFASLKKYIGKWEKTLFPFAN